MRIPAGVRRVTEGDAFLRENVESAWTPEFAKVWSVDMVGEASIGLAQLEVIDTLVALQALSRKRPVRVLDLGCGSGPLAREIASAYPNSEVVGLDIAAPQLDYARQAASAAKLTNVQFVKQNGGDPYPFPDQHFDGIVSYQAFQHFPNKKDALKEMFRVLKPGGVLSIDWFADSANGLPSSPELWELVMEWAAKNPSEASKIAYPDRIHGDAPTIRRFLNEVGFTDVWVREVLNGGIKQYEGNIAFFAIFVDASIVKRVYEDTRRWFEERNLEFSVTTGRAIALRPESAA